MKIIKNSFSIIVWVLLIVLSNILLSNSAHGMGEYRIAAWEYVQPLFAHSALFWSIGILLLIQVLLINLKSFRYKDGIVVFITIVIIIVSVIFYWHITRIMTSYNTIIQNTNGVPEIGNSSIKLSQIFFGICNCFRYIVDSKCYCYCNEQQKEIR